RRRAPDAPGRPGPRAGVGPGLRAPAGVAAGPRPQEGVAAGPGPRVRTGVGRLGKDGGCPALRGGRRGSSVAGHDTTADARRVAAVRPAAGTPRLPAELRPPVRVGPGGVRRLGVPGRIDPART